MIEWIYCTVTFFAHCILLVTDWFFSLGVIGHPVTTRVSNFGNDMKLYNCKQSWLSLSSFNTNPLYLRNYPSLTIHNSRNSQIVSLGYVRRYNRLIISAIQTSSWFKENQVMSITVEWAWVSHHIPFDLLTFHTISISHHMPGALLTPSVFPESWCRWWLPNRAAWRPTRPGWSPLSAITFQPFTPSVFQDSCCRWWLSNPAALKPIGSGW